MSARVLDTSPTATAARNTSLRRADGLLGLVFIVITLLALSRGGDQTTYRTALAALVLAVTPFWLNRAAVHCHTRRPALQRAVKAKRAGDDNLAASYWREGPLAAETLPWDAYLRRAVPVFLCVLGALAAAMRMSAAGGSWSLGAVCLLAATALGSWCALRLTRRELFGEWDLLMALRALD